MNDEISQIPTIYLKCCPAQQQKNNKGIVESTTWTRHKRLIDYISKGVMMKQQYKKLKQT